MSSQQPGEAKVLKDVEIRVLGTRVHGVDRGQSLAWIDAWAQLGRRAHIATVNPEFVMRARRDAIFHAVLERTCLNVADGIGVVIAARLRHESIPARVTGVALVRDMMELAAARKWTVALVGGEPGVGQAAADRLVRDNPDLPPPHVYAGTREPEGDPEAQSFMREVQPRILCVGFGAPHQEFWIDRNVAADAACVAIGVGGTLDYLSGRVPRAPTPLRALGLEWAYRLWIQPGRWRRMLALPAFALLAAQEVWRLNKDIPPP